MSRRLGLLFIFSLTASGAASGVLFQSQAFAKSSSESSKQDLNAKEIRDRLNKIFYWQLSDELKLSPAQEKAVVSVLEETQQNRDDTFVAREEAMQALQKLSKTATLEQTRPHLERYSQALQALSNIEKDEYAALKAAIGEELLGRFYVIREDVTSRVRKALKK